MINPAPDRKKTFLSRVPFIVNRNTDQRRSKVTTVRNMKGVKLQTTSKSAKKAPDTHGLPGLRKKRQEKGLSLGQLADMTSIRKEQITHFESCREDPLPYQVRLLAKALEIPQLELLG